MHILIGFPFILTDQDAYIVSRLVRLQMQFETVRRKKETANEPLLCRQSTPHGEDHFPEEAGIPCRLIKVDATHGAKVPDSRHHVPLL